MKGMDIGRNCQCDACDLVRKMKEQNYSHYLCKSANNLVVWREQK